MDFFKKFSQSSDPRKEQQRLQQVRTFTFMLTNNDVGKSVNIKAEDPQSAENTLRQNYSGWNIQYLWEWK